MTLSGTNGRVIFKDLTSELATPEKLPSRFTTTTGDAIWRPQAARWTLIFKDVSGVVLHKYTTAKLIVARVSTRVSDDLDADAMSGVLQIFEHGNDIVIGCAESFAWLKSKSNHKSFFEISKPPKAAKRATLICGFAGCERAQKAKGWCFTHYAQSRIGVMRSIGRCLKTPVTKFNSSAPPALIDAARESARTQGVTFRSWICDAMSTKIDR